jgi:hypothetical protein
VLAEARFFGRRTAPTASITHSPKTAPPRLLAILPPASRPARSAAHHRLFCYPNGLRNMRSPSITPPPCCFGRGVNSTNLVRRFFLRPVPENNVLPNGDVILQSLTPTVTDLALSENCRFCTVAHDATGGMRAYRCFPYRTQLATIFSRGVAPPGHSFALYPP